MNRYRSIVLFSLAFVGFAAIGLANTGPTPEAHYGSGGLASALYFAGGDQTTHADVIISSICTPGFTTCNEKPYPLNICMDNAGSAASVNRPGDGTCVNNGCNAGCIGATGLLGSSSTSTPGTQCDGGGGLCGFRDTGVAVMFVVGSAGKGA